MLDQEKPLGIQVEMQQMILQLTVSRVLMPWQKPLHSGKLSTIENHMDYSPAQAFSSIMNLL
jgi:hypothetical protein